MADGCTVQSKGGEMGGGFSKDQRKKPKGKTLTCVRVHVQIQARKDSRQVPCFPFLSRKKNFLFLPFSFSLLSHFIRGSRRVWRSFGRSSGHSVNSVTCNLWGRGYLRPDLLSSVYEYYPRVGCQVVVRNGEQTTYPWLACSIF